MEKLYSSLAVLAEIFEEVAYILRKVWRCFVIILAEFDLEFKTLLVTTTQFSPELNSQHWGGFMITNL